MPPAKGHTPNVPMSTGGSHCRWMLPTLLAPLVPGMIAADKAVGAGGAAAGCVKVRGGAAASEQSNPWAQADMRSVDVVAADNAGEVGAVMLHERTPSHSGRQRGYGIAIDENDDASNSAAGVAEGENGAKGFNVDKAADARPDAVNDDSGTAVRHTGPLPSGLSGQAG